MTSRLRCGSAEGKTKTEQPSGLPERRETSTAAAAEGLRATARIYFAPTSLPDSKAIRYATVFMQRILGYFVERPRGGAAKGESS